MTMHTIIQVSVSGLHCCVCSLFFCLHGEHVTDFLLSAVLCDWGQHSQQLEHWQHGIFGTIVLFNRTTSHGCQKLAAVYSVCWLHMVWCFVFVHVFCCVCSPTPLTVLHTLSLLLLFLSNTKSSPHYVLLLPHKLFACCLVLLCFCFLMQCLYDELCCDVLFVLCCNVCVGLF